MFCLMDVSGSMGEREKDLAKRFFMLLHLFLQRRYERIDIVFIRHTHEAKEVDEETFFHSRETGGTVVSTALIEMKQIHRRSAIRRRTGTSMPPRHRTATTWSGDTEELRGASQTMLLPVCQYFAYIEICRASARWRCCQLDGERRQELWRAISASVASAGRISP